MKNPQLAVIVKGRAYEVHDETGLVCSCWSETQARIILDCLWTMRRLVQDFPGLHDTETEVGGADLVDWMTTQLHESHYLRMFTAQEYAEAMREKDEP